MRFLLDAALRRLEHWGFAVILFGAALAYLLRLSGLGFEGEGVVRTTVPSILTIDNPDYAARQLMLVYPPLPYYGAMLIDALPISRPLPSGLLLSAAIAGLLAAAIYRALREAGYSEVETPVMAALLFMQPPVLWAIAQGPQAILAVAAMYAAGRSAIQLRAGASVISKTRLAMTLPVLALADVSGLVAALCLALVLAGFVQRQDLLRSVTGTYVILIFPLAFAIGTLCYVNWLFLSDPFVWLRQIGARFVGPGGEIAVSPWLREYVSEFGRPLLPWLFMLAISCPALPLGLASLWGRTVLIDGRPAHLGPAIAGLLVALALMVPLGTMLGAAAHPYPYLALACGLAPVVAVTWPASGGRSAALVSALVFGIMGSVLSVTLWAPPELVRWRNACLGVSVPMDITRDQSLAAFLADKQGVMIDERTAGRAIVLRGSGKGLRVSTSPAFIMAANSGQLTAPLVAVPDAETDLNGTDRVRRNFETLFDRGARGYALVYDQAGWRVYARTAPAGDGAQPAR